MTDKKNKQYSNKKLILNIVSFALSIVFLLILYFSGFTVYLSDSLSSINSVFLNRLVFIVIFSIVLKILSIPLEIYSGFIVEHKFGLSRQTIGGYLKEDLKASVLSLIMTIIFIEFIYFLFDFSPDNWWFFVWIGWNLFNIFVAFIFPNFILPLFYKLEKIENEEFLNSIYGLCSKTGFDKFRGKIYSFNLGKDTVKANAAVIGLGSSRKIILADTLIEKFSLDEINSVLAHEIGHAKKRHILKILILTIIGSFIVLFVSQMLLILFLEFFGITNISDISNLPLIMLYFVILFFVFAPLNNFMSRKMEVEADEFACKNYGPEHFVSAMEKLRDLNLADEDPNPVVEFLFYSHPSIKNRIKKAEL